jgi:2-keto-4-pentenoate hydratase/2-oxohepta-3-ene-1,7-dioic acid hydratase in catechol pathway
MRPLFIHWKERAFDSSALDYKQVHAEVRTGAMAAMRSGTNRDLLLALSGTGEWLVANLGFGEKTNHAAGLQAQILKLPIPPPIRRRQFICVRMNYRDHRRESKVKFPVRPVLLAKASNAVNEQKQLVDVPHSCQQLDFEMQLTVMVANTCGSVQAANALSCVAGFTCTNDISARDFQFTDGQWFRGKSCDGLSPLGGPWAVTRANISEQRALGIRCQINGQVMQDLTTENLFDTPALVEFISAFITLEPGDVNATCTPLSARFRRKPALYLRSGDRVEVEIKDVGVSCNKTRRHGRVHD